MDLHPASHGRVVRTLVAVSASLSLFAGVGLGIASFQWYQLRDEGTVYEFAPAVPSGSVSIEPLPPTGRCSDHPCNFLILGSDSRQGLSQQEQDRFGTDEQIGGENRADSIMLIHTDPGQQQAAIVSFPRDLWVPIPGVGEAKINTAFEGGITGGGPQLMAQTVANLTGLRVDHFLYVDLAGFQRIVDTLGGVDMCIPDYLADPDTGRVQDPLTALDIAPGCQRLEGRQALAYVRTRSLRCDAIPDFSRIGRQQQFLRAVITAMLQPEQVVKAPGLVGPIVSNLKRDREFLPGDLIYMVGQMQGLTTGAAEFRSVPGTAGWEGALSVVHMDPSAEQIFEALRDGTPLGEVGTRLLNTPPSEANIEVAVAEQGSAEPVDEVGSILAEAGFDVSPGVWARDDVPSGLGGAALLYAPGSDAEAQVVRRYFPGMKVREWPGLPGADVVLVIPSNYVRTARPITVCPSVA